MHVYMEIQAARDQEAEEVRADGWYAEVVLSSGIFFVLMFVVFLTCAKDRVIMKSGSASSILKRLRSMLKPRWNVESSGEA